MPFSGTFCDNHMTTFLKEIDPPASVLDIGAGNGKYGLMVKEHCPSVIELIGVEIEPDYVVEYKLNTIYNQVIIGSATCLMRQVDRQYDLVILGDVVEHLRKSDGIDLIHFLAYRCKYMVIIYPERMLQNSWNGYSAEAHISSWSYDDFAIFDPAMVKVAHKQFVAIDGYQPHQWKCKQVVFGV